MCVLLMGTTRTTGGGRRVASSEAHPHMLCEPESPYHLTWHCGGDVRADDRRRAHLPGRGCRGGRGEYREDGRSWPSGPPTPILRSGSISAMRTPTAETAGSTFRRRFLLLQAHVWR